MSEGSTRANPTRAATPAPVAPAAGPPPTAGPARGLLPSLVPLLREWLPRQRWFAGKGRPITGFSLVSATELLPSAPGGPAPGLLHLLVRAEQSGGAPPDRPAPPDCYQLLLGVRSDPPPQLAHAVIGRPGGGPLDGRTVYDALQDPRLAGLLLERLRAPGRIGTLRFTRAPSTAIPSGLLPRPVTTEQSNSSVVYGDAYILKVFRRVGLGTNPDLELPLTLARAGCGRVPHPTAWFETDPGPAGGLTGSGRAPRVRHSVSAEATAPGPAGNSGPGAVREGAVREAAAREGAVREAAAREAAAAPEAEPMTLGILQPFLPGSADGWQLALNSLSVRADFTGAARALGRATAEVHTALASALPTAVLRRQQIDLLAAGMTERLEAAAAAVPALRPYREPLRAAFDAFAALGRRGRAWPAQRIHGDLHLGQTLRTAHDGRWALIDFEGEPARPIAERRRPQPVARDIAGMLRSFDYAARTHRPAPGTSAWSQEWAARNRAAYCEGYAAAAGADPRDEPELMRAYETDKAVYEVLYEARHRPDWLPVPMAAIHRLAGFRDGGPPPELSHTPDAWTAPEPLGPRPAGAVRTGDAARRDGAARTGDADRAGNAARTGGAAPGDAARTGDRPAPGVPPAPPA
ncbi:maltokinase [Streptomyces sp. NPDC001922]|uniref:maltokinase N-terminal cap-like domain-containing protein n=1 Tax=Streptomyces sp. NPDC001922 TaxID=3364624 RepID=UPI003688CC0E